MIKINSKMVSIIRSLDLFLMFAAKNYLPTDTSVFDKNVLRVIACDMKNRGCSNEFIKVFIGDEYKDVSKDFCENCEIEHLTTPDWYVYYGDTRYVYYGETRIPLGVTKDGIYNYLEPTALVRLDYVEFDEIYDDFKKGIINSHECSLLIHFCAELRYGIIKNKPIDIDRYKEIIPLLKKECKRYTPIYAKEDISKLLNL